MILRSAVRVPFLTGPDFGERLRLAASSLPYRLHRAIRDSKEVPSDPTPDDSSVPSRQGFCGSGTSFGVRAQPSSGCRSVDDPATLAPVLLPRLSRSGTSIGVDTLRCLCLSRDLRRASDDYR